MAKDREVTIKANGIPDPFVSSISAGDKITFKPETQDTVVDVTFSMASPIIEWRSKKEPKGKPLKGTVNDCVQMGDRFEYKVGPTSRSRAALAGPELIVDGGLAPKRKKKTAARKTGAARKRTGAKNKTGARKAAKKR